MVKPISGLPKPPAGGNSAPRPNSSSVASMPTAPQRSEFIYAGVPVYYEIYENAHDETPNRLYRRYRKWHHKKYGNKKEPMSFKSWLKWAQEKGFISADGEVTPKAKDEKANSPAAAAGSGISENAKKTFAIVLGISVVAGLIYAIS